MRTLFSVLLAALCLLSGCAPEAAAPAAAPDPPAAASVPSPAAEARAPEAAEQPPESEAPAALPEDPALWTLADFAPALCAADAAEERYAIAAGTEWENEVVVRRGAAEGPAVYIVGGIHGDETAGWTAANLLKTICPDAGTVYLLSPANRYGAENDRRTTRSMRDLNRCFPGKSDGWDAEQIAASIYADIADKQPALVLDLHETKGPQASAPERDDLRGSVIVCDVAPVADLIWDLTVDGAWTLLGSPPAGSINRTVSEELGIPVLTLETWRADALSVRVAQQLRFVRAVLDYCGVLSGQ